MGQRSQIYVAVDGKLEVANYYQWNYGDRMISRARHGIEWIKVNIDYPSTLKRSRYNFEAFRRIWDVNFDYGDIAISIDMFAEYEKYFKGDSTFADFALNIDNNDGKLFVMVDTKNQTVKYTLTDDDMNILTPKQYMEWDYPEWETSEYLDDGLREKCRNNMIALDELAQQMTEEELRQFLDIVVCNEFDVPKF